MNNEIYNELVIGDFHDRLFAFMKICGIKSIDVNYSGGGDSGGVDHIDVHFYENSKLSLKEQTALNSNFVDEWEEELAQPIWNRHGGFADGGGYSVSGVVNYDAIKKTVSISGTDCFYEYGDEDNEEEEEISSERDEDWEDLIVQKQDKDVDTEENSYDLLCFYFTHVLNSPLPEEFYNRVLIAAVDGDAGAAKYIKGLKK